MKQTDSFCISLETIKLGYSTFSFSNKQLLKDALAPVATFFSQEKTYKQQFNHLGIVEYGYYDLGHKESFAIRNQQLPTELMSCITLFDLLTQFALNCLQAIAGQMQWNPQLLLESTKNNYLPLKNKSSSLLRLLHYHSPLNDSFACPMHQDLGLLSIVICTQNPGLEIFDFAQGKWVDIEANTQPFDLIIMVGETLSALSNGVLLPATHRVRYTTQPRISIVYQLRADPDAILDSAEYETPVTRTFHKPFRLTGQEFYNLEVQHRSSVNGSY